MPTCLFLTRPEADSARFAQAARAAGWRGEVLIAPMLRIALDPPPQRVLQTARTLIVTSQHGVAALVAATEARDWPIWCVGPRTAEAARDAGFADIHEGGGDARALLAALLAAAPQTPLLHLRGRHAAMNIASELRAAGLRALSHVVYAQIARPLSAEARARLAQGGDLVMPVFSPRSAQVLARALRREPLSAARLHLVAISAAAREAATGPVWASQQVAERPDAPGMLAALGRAQAALEPLEKPR